MIADMSRSCQMLQQGRFVADVCVYYGDEAPNLVPARRIDPASKPRWDDQHCLHCGKPVPVDLRSLGHGYDYDYVNEEVLLERMKVRDGNLVLPDGMSYRVLVLPDREAISPAVLRRIGELVEAGATVVGSRPERSNSLTGYPACDREVHDLAARIWGSGDVEKAEVHQYGKGRVFPKGPLDDILAEMEIASDFTVENMENKDREIDFTHRSTVDEDIYFVSNTSLSRRQPLCRFRVAPDRTPSFWHADSGSVEPCYIYQTGNGFIQVPLDLDAASSVFVVFRKTGASDHLTKVGGTPATGDAIRITAMTAGSVAARVRKSGTYPLETASGRKGEIVVDRVPADQVIDGPWKLAFPPNLGAPPEVTMPSLTDWTESSDPGVRYFSGTATYTKNFTLPQLPPADKAAVFLNLGEVREVATVTVNGKNAGILWKQPYRVEVGPFLKSGENHLEIAVTNLWNNRIVGDFRLKPEHPVTRTNVKSKFSAKSPLLPSGLVGPVKLEYEVKVADRFGIIDVLAREADGARDVVKKTSGQPMSANRPW